MLEVWHYATNSFLWHGLFVAIEITVLSLIIAWPLSIFMALARMSKRLWIRLLVAPYIWIMRGTPILLQLIFFYDVLPEIGIAVNATATAVIALSLNEIAFSSEIIRGGIQSVKPTQRRAATALGMKDWLVMRRVVLPQALTSITPALSNEAIIMLKNTSLASVIAVPELTLRSQEIVAVNFKYISVFVGAAILYLVATTVLSILQSRAERFNNLELRGERAMRHEQKKIQPTAVAPELRGGVAVEGTRDTGTDREVTVARAAAGHDLVGHLAAMARGVDGRADEGFVHIDGVRKAFHGSQVLQGVDLEVERGEVVVLLGPSGSGKSTLLYTINSLEPIDHGEIRVDGVQLGHHSGLGGLLTGRHLAKQRAEARIGLVFQQFNLFDHMSVLQNIMEAPVRVHGMDAELARKNALALLAWAGLDGCANKFVHQLSGGQQQRVAIARALACQPRLMLFDEPTSALDPELVGEVLRLIRDLAEAGMTMIVVTHEISFARRVANRVVFMSDGVVVEQGPPDKVLENPSDPRTRRFLSLLEDGDAEDPDFSDVPR